MSAASGVVEESDLLRTSPEIAGAYERARIAAGDVVLSIGPSYGKVMVVPETLAGANLTQGTARLAPGPNTDARWLYWALQARTSVGYWDAVAAGGTFHALNLGPLSETPLPLVLLKEQRRIADFLDDRVSRIDNVIAARQAQAARVEEAHAAWLERLLVAPATGPGRTLQSLTDPARPIQYGIVLPGPDFADGVPIIKGGDVRGGRIDPDRLRRTDPEIDAQYARSRVRGGDLVIAIRGSVGELALVPHELTGANLTQDSARIAPRGCDPAWLHAVLRTPTVQARMARMVVGATVRGINISDLRRIVVPVPESIEEQRVCADLAGDVDRRAASFAAAIAQSTDRLAEYKQSLITAAVTGEFDVTTSSGPGLPA